MRKVTIESINMEQRAGQEFSCVRRYPRIGVPTLFPCLFAIIRSHHRFAVEEGDVGVVYDMSVKGARLMTEATMTPGDRIVLSLRFPHHEGPAAIEWGIVRWGARRHMVSSSTSVRWPPPLPSSGFFPAKFLA